MRCQSSDQAIIRGQGMDGQYFSRSSSDATSFCILVALNGCPAIFRTREEVSACDMLVLAWDPVTVHFGLSEYAGALRWVKHIRLLNDLPEGRGSMLMCSDSTVGRLLDTTLLIVSSEKYILKLGFEGGVVSILFSRMSQSVSLGSFMPRNLKWRVDTRQNQRVVKSAFIIFVIGKAWPYPVSIEVM